MRLQKKNDQKRNRSQQKKLPSQTSLHQARHRHTHKKYPATRFQTEKWSIKNSYRGRIAETQKEGLDRE